MAQQALLEKISCTSTSLQRRNSSLLKKVAAKAVQTAHEKEVWRREELRRTLEIQRQVVQRVQLALKGMRGLCEIGRSPQFQSLIAARGKPLALWGYVETATPGFDMVDIHWKYANYIEMTASELNLHNYVADSGDYGRTFKITCIKGEYPLLTFSYAVDDDLLRASQLSHIATSEYYEKDAWNRDDFQHKYSTELLFQTIVRCADAKQLGKLFRAAINR